MQEEENTSELLTDHHLL